MAMQQQLDFIAYIQRMLVEGDFSATYKFALLHALADISIEKQQIDPSAQLQITFDELVEKSKGRRLIAVERVHPWKMGPPR